VDEFIGKDSIILGHNVFFDVAMLETHGIDLRSHPIVDTFELSEILSQKSASLNLGFLADFYQIPKRGAEHRALTDTWLTVDLLIKFLENIETLPDIQKEIWETFILRNDSPLHFLKIFYKKPQAHTSLLEKFFENQKIWTKNPDENFHDKNNSSEKDFEIFSLENMETDGN